MTRAGVECGRGPITRLSARCFRVHRAVDAGLVRNQIGERVGYLLVLWKLVGRVEAGEHLPLIAVHVQRKRAYALVAAFPSYQHSILPP